MFYPKFIKNKIIGVTAPSGGSSDIVDLLKLENAINNFNKIDYKVLITDNCKTSFNGRSSSIEERKKQLEDLFINKDVEAIICFSGGDFLLEIIDKIDFHIIKNNPKWIQGYSDPTSLLFIITTNLDIATIYSNNFKAFSMKKWHSSLLNNISLLEGKTLEQSSFEMFEEERIKSITGDEGFNLTRHVKWENLNDESSIEMEGRLIGGCLDVLLNLVGTRFDKTTNFIEKYKNDGFIWYFDNFGLTSEKLILAMWQLKNSGWFKYTKGIIFGRSTIEESHYDISFKDAIKEGLSDLNVPIIINADIGHKPPQLTLINGALAKIKSKDNKGTIIFELR